MKVSVIIPLYNQKQWVAQAIESAKLQTHRDVEIIVVNDGSTDDPHEVLDKWDVDVIDQRNRGLAAARNMGIAAAAGQYYIPLDADDTIDWQYIEKTIPLMEDNVAAVVTNFNFFGEYNAIGDVEIPTLEQELYTNKLPCCGLYRKSAVVSFGGYRTMEALPNGGYEDWNLWIDILKRGWRVKMVDEVLFHYRVHSSDGTSMYQKAKAHHEELVATIRGLHPELYK